MAMLEIKDLNVFYGGIHALKGISLEVEQAEKEIAQAEKAKKEAESERNQ